MGIKKKLLLIDGDEICYKAGFASQTTFHNVLTPEGEILSRHRNKKDAIEWIGNREGDFEIESEVVPKPPETAIFALNAVINTILHDTRPVDYRVYLSGENNFRIGVATLLPYKGTRAVDGRPFYYGDIRQRLIDEFFGMIVDGMEADDALSITAWHHYVKDTSWEPIIASQDKDLKMVPGWNYNPPKRKLINISPADARMSFYCQLMSGDRTDNIPGVYRIGEVVAARKLLRLKNAKNIELYRAVLKEYNNAQKNPLLREKMPGDKWGDARLAEIGRLLWMLQEKDQIWKPKENYYASVGLS